MVRVETLKKRLDKLDAYLAILEKLKNYTRDEFLADPERFGSAERFLHLSIEAVNDMGNHVIADLGLGEVNWYSDIPKRLREHRIIDADLEKKWVRMIGFRNTLVHDYIDIDRDIVFQVLHGGLADLRTLQKVFSEFL